MDGRLAATVTYTSTPGANPDEHTGADGEGPDATTLDNYAASDSAAVVTEPRQRLFAVGKSLVDSTVDETTGDTLAVGETATFRVLVEVTGNQPPTLVIEDALPDGMTFIDGTVAIQARVGGAPVAITPTSVAYDAATNVLTVSLPELPAPPSDAIANSFVVMTFDPDDTGFTNTASAFPDPIDLLEIRRLLYDPEEPVEEDEEEMLTVAPIFSGRGPAGASIVVTLIGEHGAPVGTATTLVAENGTWTLSMPDVALPAQPLNAIVTVFPAPVRMVDTTAEQVFYGPASDTPITFRHQVVTFDVSETESFDVLQAMIAATENPVPSVSSRGLVNFELVTGTQINN
ncbi:hypothetical protein [Acuticoccus sp. I52.16.1]|uniref:hypothetical protein n=1 Tax=Acuticoccus sp. I52.16.1 TaxID=2928472 RepID=UPI001FD36994|nr:hypothetical protein [Acuticoccus sp. I52.16.1]UOM36227.1 hypothetical protein MRB58_08575 [Acuticoccus sp. I52.16.1]